VAIRRKIAYLQKGLAAPQLDFGFVVSCPVAVFNGGYPW
jgi:hypothetical protein